MQTLREVDGDLINHWYIACLEKEVPASAPIRREVYEIPYVIFRDQAGKVKVFVDQCIHRKAKLSLGKCENGNLRCGYHGWMFDGEGKVVEVPSEGGACDKNRKGKLKEVPTAIQDGCVWIWPGEKAKATAAPPWRFPERGNKAWAQYFMITDFENEVTHLVQNFMDVPHTVFVHDKWFRRRKLLSVPIILNHGNGRVKVEYLQTKDSIGFMERILNQKKEPMVHTDEYIFPNITRVDYSFGKSGFIINSQCTPVGRYNTRVYTWIAYRLPYFTHAIKGFISFYTRKVIEQDVEIMKNQGDNLKQFEQLGEEPDFRSGLCLSTAADEPHLMVDRMRFQGIENRSKPLMLETPERRREFWI